jgi:hypothetical protein
MDFMVLPHPEGAFPSPPSGARGLIGERKKGCGLSGLHYSHHKHASGNYACLNALGATQNPVCTGSLSFPGNAARYGDGAVESRTVVCCQRYRRDPTNAHLLGKAEQAGRNKFIV